VIDPATANTTIVNTATIGAAGDPIPANDSGSATIEVVAPQVSFSSADYSVEENAGTATIVVELNVANPAADVLVDYATSDGSALAGNDYTAISGTLTIPRGQI